MLKVTPYWTQKNLIATYYKSASGPEEHLLVWQMYWRGENFYTQNEIYEGPQAERTVFLGDKNVENLKAWIAKHRGHRAFFLVERSRWSQLAGARAARGQGLAPHRRREQHEVLPRRDRPLAGLDATGRRPGWR